MSIEHKNHRLRNLATASAVVVGLGAGFFIARASDVLRPKDTAGATGNSIFTPTPYAELLRTITPTEYAVIAAATATRIPSPTAEQQKTPTQVPTIAPTKEPTATPTTIPTVAAIDTATATAVATAPATAPAEQKVEKMPLLEYQPYMGKIYNVTTDAEEGMAVVALIPGLESESNIYVFFYIKLDGSSYSGLPFMASLTEVKDNSFKAGRIWSISATLENNRKKLTGKISNGLPGKPPEWETRLDLTATNSTGKDAVINASKHIKAAVRNMGNIPDSQVRLDEFLRFIDFNKWPE